jgi:transposase
LQSCGGPHISERFSGAPVLLVALDDNGKILLKRKFTQKQLIAFTANLQRSLIGMEACGGAHFLGRALRAQGHEVKLIPTQFVKPFVKSNKNDFIAAYYNPPN